MTTERYYQLRTLVSVRAKLLALDVSSLSDDERRTLARMLRARGRVNDAHRIEGNRP
jgi:hypothetical protein